MFVLAVVARRYDLCWFYPLDLGRAVKLGRGRTSLRKSKAWLRSFVNTCLLRDRMEDHSNCTSMSGVI